MYTLPCDLYLHPTLLLTRLGVHPPPRLLFAKPIVQPKSELQSYADSQLWVPRESPLPCCSGRIRLSDQHSTNGVYVNARRVRPYTRNLGILS